MEGYVRFTNASSPLPSRANSTVEYDTDESTPSPQLALAPLREEQQHWWQAPARWWQQWWAWLNAPPATPYESGYLTLIPLSDARLRPRRTKLIVSSLLLLTVLAAVGVFLLVPRGVSVGSITVHSTRMTFNATTLTYRIILQADVPIYNPNYLKASVTGNVTVAFFDAAAGWSAVGPVTLPARVDPAKMSVKVDASNLPRKYTQVVYTHCFNFPRKLIFFLLGNFKARYLGYEKHLPKIDTYFILDCSGAKQNNSSALLLQEQQEQWQPEQEQGQQQQAPMLLQHAGSFPAATPGQQQELANAAAGSAAAAAAAGAAAEPPLLDWELEVEGVVSLAQHLHLQVDSPNKGLLPGALLKT